VTARSFEQQILRRWQAKHGVSSRAVSILLALLADVGLALVLVEQSRVSSTEEGEPFWIRQFIVFARYSATPLWTSAYQTDTGDEFAATIDKVFPASPAIVTALIQMYWIGHNSAATLSWRQHIVSAIWFISQLQISLRPTSPISVCG
jgi:hypothetical protein